MKYSSVRRPTDGPLYCFAGHVDPKVSLRLANGVDIGDRYSGDPESVRVPLRPESPGLKPPDLLGNTKALLILSARALDAFAAAEIDLSNCNICPFVLINHKGRVHSRDYSFVNPLGTHDVAHPSSDFVRFPDGKPFACRDWVLDETKLVDTPHILRPKEVVGHYFVSQAIVDVVNAEGLTNFTFVEPKYVRAS